VGCDSSFNYGIDSKAVSFFPFTVIQTSATVVDTTLLSGIVANYTAIDDVFSAAFLAGIAPRSRN